MPDESNTAVLELPQEVRDTTSERYDQVIGLEADMYAAKRRAMQTGKKDDKELFETLENRYTSVSARDRVEAQLTRFLRIKESERKEGSLPSDPGGEAIYFRKKKDRGGNVIKDAHNSPIWELFTKGGLFNGWTNDEGGSKGTITQVSEQLTNLTAQAHTVISEVATRYTLREEEQEYIRRSLERANLDHAQARVVIQFLVAQGLSVEEAKAKLDPKKLVEALVVRLKQQQDPRQGFQDYFMSLGIRDDYVRRFVLPAMFEDVNNGERMQGPKQSVEELAWKITMTDKAHFNVDGQFPVLELRVIRDKNGKIDRQKSNKLYVNKGNLNRWILERIDELWDSKPHDFVDYFSEVRLKTGPISMYDIPLGEIFHAKTAFLKSEFEWLDTTDEFVRDLQLDPWIQLYGRTAYLTDELKIQGDEKAIVEGAKAIHNENKATRKTFGSNMIYWAATSPLNPQGTTEKEKYVLRDGIKGAAWNEILLIYQHISDFDKLQEVLGEDSEFFTQKAMLTAMEEYATKIAGHTARPDVRGFLGDDLYAAYEKAFDKNTGKVIDKTAFIKLVNIFNAHAQDSNQVKMVREKLVINAIKKKYGGFKTERGEEDGYSLRYAERLAYDWTAPSLTGIWALNDESAQAYKGWTKWIRTGLYRMKMAGDKSAMRAGALGNPRTTLLFKQLYVPFTWAVNTKKAIDVVDAEGNVVRDKDGKVMTRQKSADEVMHELQQVRMAQMQYLNQKRVELRAQGKNEDQINEEIAPIEYDFQKSYLKKAGELDFNDNAQRTHQLDHIDRIAKLWDIIIGAKEIDFEKFTKYDPYSPGMPRFDRAEFQKQIQDEFLKPLRYAYQTYGDINYNMIVRGMKIVPDSKPFTWKTVWENMPLGQALFGHELLDRPEFWARSKNGIPLRDRQTGQRLIDYNKVQENKLLIWKQWAIMKIAADIQQHRLRYSMDIKHHPTFYQHIFDALESIPGAIWANEFHMSETQIPVNFFDEHDMAILKKKGLASPFLGFSKIPFTNINLAEKLTKLRFYLNWIWKDLRAKEDQEGSGISILLGMFFKDVFKGM